MPQTIEAIHHSRAAEVPIVVAINKIDKHEANQEKVKPGTRGAGRGARGIRRGFAVRSGVGENRRRHRYAAGTGVAASRSARAESSGGYAWPRAS